MNHVLRCHEIHKTDFVRGEGCWLIDTQGGRWLDLESGIWAACLGHSHPRIQRAMVEQIGRVVHLGTRYPHFLTEEAARDLLDVVGLEGGRCVFLSSGSEAVELGVTALRRVTGRPIVLSLSASYLAAYGSAGTRPPEGWRMIDRDLSGAHLEQVLDAIPFHEVAGFAFEPGGSGVAHVRFPSAPLVQAVVERVRLAGGLLLANEVTSGMGRTGRWFGFQHYDVRPDVVALGKGLGGGYPVSAVAMSGEVAERLENSGFRWAQSHQNDPLGCAVVREVIAVLREEGLVAEGQAIGARFLEGLCRIAARHPCVRDVRGRGLLLAMELQPDAPRDVTNLYNELLRRGFLVGYHPAGRILRFDPSLVVTDAEIDGFLACLDEVLLASTTPGTRCR